MLARLLATGLLAGVLFSPQTGTTGPAPLASIALGDIDKGSFC